ncbi:MAG: pyridoxamine 5'-phosphate oxidase family protein [Myxococcota bacterium]|jgi:general stress protein 26|nr:pyridoxamine 5'-phosphate oxidase family protein [Myxococcota bacterium]
MSSDKPQDYEKVSMYNLDDEGREELLSTAIECIFNWCTKDEWPMGVVMSCLWHDGRMWLTAGGHRHRISAVRRNPQVSVVVTSTGTVLGPGKSVTIKGRCKIHEDQKTKDWFYPAFASHTSISPDPNAAKAFEEMLDSPIRVVLEVVPEKFITYDGIKMVKHTAGVLDESELGPLSESDTQRLERELEKRGLS